MKYGILNESCAFVKIVLPMNFLVNNDQDSCMICDDNMVEVCCVCMGRNLKKEGRRNLFKSW